MYFTYQSKEGDYDNATPTILYVYWIKKEYTNRNKVNQLIYQLRRRHNLNFGLVNMDYYQRLIRVKVIDV